MKTTFPKEHSHISTQLAVRHDWGLLPLIPPYKTAELTSRFICSKCPERSSSGASNPQWDISEHCYQHSQAYHAWLPSACDSSNCGKRRSLSFASQKSGVAGIPSVSGYPLDKKRAFPLDHDSLARVLLLDERVFALAPATTLRAED